MMHFNSNYKLIPFLFLIFYLATPLIAEEKRVVKIGVLTDLSGKASYLGQQTRVAAQLFQEELDSSDTKLEIVLGDHSLDTAKAVSETQKFLNIDKVDAIFSNFSGTTRAASSVAKDSGKLFVYTAAAMEPVKTNPNSFKGYLDYVEGCKKLAELWKKEGLTRVAILKVESEFGELCLQGASIVYPNLYEISYKSSEVVNTQVLQLKSKKIEAILNPGYEGDMINMLKSLSILKFEPKIGSNEDVFTDKLITDYKENLKNAYAFGLPSLPESFITRIKNLDSKNIIGAVDQAGMSYLHIKQMFIALSKCPNRDIICQMNIMQNSPEDKQFGFLGFDNSRQAKYSWIVTKFIDGKFLKTNH